MRLVSLALGAIAAMAWSVGGAATHAGEFRIVGNLAQSCSTVAPASQTINPMSVEMQIVGTPSYTCNFVGSPTLRFWSLNGGTLVAPASTANGNKAQSRTYEFDFDGAALGELTNNSSTATPIVRTIFDPNDTQMGVARIKISAPADVAGSYSDTIFLSVTP